jgi:putative peptide zinc metalloprotease protein
MLADYLEIPNMADRAGKYLAYLIKRYALRMKDAVSSVQAPGEAPWLCIYAIASFAYRIFISLGIFLFVAGKFFVIGVILALWAGFSMIVWPLVKVVRHVAGEMRDKALLAAAVSAAVICPLLAFIIWFPLPSSTVTEGVVWVPEDSQVVAGTDGFVVKVLATPGQRVGRGDPLIFCDAPDLKAQLKVLEAGLEEVAARLRISFVTDRTRTGILKDEMAGVQAKIARAEERMAEMIVRSPGSGTFLLPDAEDWPGRFVHKGAPVGYVVDFSRTVVRVIVNQADVEHIRHRTTRVEARLADSLTTVVPAYIEREVPAASKELPSIALSVQGGGRVALDPKETRRPQAFEKLFHFDIVLPRTTARGIGERVFVRFVHTPEPLFARWYRAARRVLLRRLSV